MCATPHDHPVHRAERGGTFLAVLFVLLGSCLLLFAAFFLVAAISLLFDHDDFGAVVVALLFGAGFAALGLKFLRKGMNQGNAAGRESYVPDMHAPQSSSSQAAAAHLGAPEKKPKHEADADEKNSSPSSSDDRELISRELIAGSGSTNKPLATSSQSVGQSDEVIPADAADANSAGMPTVIETAASASPEHGFTVTVSAPPLPEQAPPKRKRGTVPAKNSTPSASDELAGLVTRSHNVFATLQDFVRHEVAKESAGNRHLTSMLQASGLMRWEDAPTIEAGRLARTHHFWLRMDTDSLSEADYDRFVSVEAALNVNQDLGGNRTFTVDESYPAIAHKVFSQLSNQHIAPYNPRQVIEAACPGRDVSELKGEWAVRANISSAAECAITPFRFSYDQRVNVEKGVAAISLETPRPRCMAIFTSDPKEQATLARSYALRLATLLASNTIDHSKLADRPLISTVYVNCHEAQSSQTLLSVRFDQASIDELTSLIGRGNSLEEGAFPSSEAIRASLGQDGWFEPVEPLLALDDELVSPKWRFDYPELNDNPTSDMLRAITGARKVSELGINENAARFAAWDKLYEEGGSSTEQLVSKLKRELYESRDITVNEACNRTIEALLDGSVDAQDEEKLRRIFVGGNTLEQAVALSEEILAESDEPEGIERVTTVLSEALSPLRSLGVYLDDSDTIYRYFGSVAERIRFNLDVDDHQRKVCLVPDAYFNALSTLSFVYGSLGEIEKAMECAEELCRIAPASIQASLRKVRILEHQSRTYEAADLLKSMLRLASTPRDAAICHYRLAFLEWKLGREDLAVACYERSLTWQTEISEQSHEELNDLLSSNENLHALKEDEVIALLAKEGIPLGCDASDLRRTLGAAANCIDEGIFWTAQPLVGLLFSATGDDVLMGVYHSLSPTL